MEKSKGLKVKALLLTALIWFKGNGVTTALVLALAFGSIGAWSLRSKFAKHDEKVAKSETRADNLGIVVDRKTTEEEAGFKMDQITGDFQREAVVVKKSKEKASARVRQQAPASGQRPLPAADVAALRASDSELRGILESRRARFGDPGADSPES